MQGLLPSPCQPASKPFHDDLLLIWVTVGSALMAVFTPPPLGTEAGSRGGFAEAGGLGTEGEEERRRGRAPLGSVYSGSHQVIFDGIKMSFGSLYLAQLGALEKKHLTFKL